MSDTIWIHFACNNEHGNHTGYVEMVEIGDGELMTLEEGRQVRFYCRGNRHKWRLGHIDFQAISYTTWAGNMMWDAAKVTFEDAARIVNYLRRRTWTCSAAEVGLYAAYEARQEITAEMLRMAMAEEVTNG